MSSQIGWGRVTADLLASLCNSWQEHGRPNLLLPTLDAPFHPARADVAIMHAGMGVMNGGERKKSDRSAKQFMLNLPAPLAHLRSAGSRALRGNERIMAHSDNATAPAVTKGSPCPLPLVMKNE